MQRNLVSSCICFRGGSRKTWKVKNVKWQKAWVRGKQLFRFCFFYPSIFTCQNLDQSWSRSSLVGGNRELWQTVTHKEEKQPNFCMYMISSAIWDKSALFSFFKDHKLHSFFESWKNLLALIYPKLHSKLCPWLPIQIAARRTQSYTIAGLHAMSPELKYWVISCFKNFTFMRYESSLTLTSL